MRWLAVVGRHTTTSPTHTHTSPLPFSLSSTKIELKAKDQITPNPILLGSLVTARELQGIRRADAARCRESVATADEEREEQEQRWI
eukprot:m.446656 g.446656  ORF g.446656 m.446656 type:complete len:87 (+) comp150959_c0_seq1:51-311(+)